MADHTHAELVMLYEQATQDIRTFQERQTSVTYLTAVIYAGLIAYANEFPSESFGLAMLVVLIAVAIAAAFAAWHWLTALQDAMHRARGKVQRVKEGFTDEFKKASGEGAFARVEASDTIYLMRGVLLVGLILSLLAFCSQFAREAS